MDSAKRAAIIAEIESYGPLMGFTIKVLPEKVGNTAVIAYRVSWPDGKTANPWEPIWKVGEVGYVVGTWCLSEEQLEQAVSWRDLIRAEMIDNMRLMQAQLVPVFYKMAKDLGLNLKTMGDYCQKSHRVVREELTKRFHEMLAVENAAAAEKAKEARV